MVYEILMRNYLCCIECSLYSLQNKLVSIDGPPILDIHHVFLVKLESNGNEWMNNRVKLISISHLCMSRLILFSPYRISMNIRVPYSLPYVFAWTRRLSDGYLHSIYSPIRPIVFLLSLANTSCYSSYLQIRNSLHLFAFCISLCSKVRGH